LGTLPRYSGGTGQRAATAFGDLPGDSETGTTLIIDRVPATVGCDLQRLGALALELRYALETHVLGPEVPYRQ
jgi:hypothetical protein